ncbi:hypothetical protein TI05_02620 [Achromatium sp. WMS3]|nr:hypothetical protein TI05_02620 [Achromatium sp. WMS3]
MNTQDIANEKIGNKNISNISNISNSISNQDIFDENAWYAIRTLYLWGQNSNGANVIEERIVAFKAPSYMDAFTKAQEEAEDYAVSGGTEQAYTIHPNQLSYHLDAGELIDGHEVWSELFATEESLDEFYENRYVRYEYQPDP